MYVKTFFLHLEWLFKSKWWLAQLAWCMGYSLLVGEVRGSTLGGLHERDFPGQRPGSNPSENALKPLLWETRRRRWGLLISSEWIRTRAAKPSTRGHFPCMQIPRCTKLPFKKKWIYPLFTSYYVFTRPQSTKKEDKILPEKLYIGFSLLTMFIQ